MVKNDLLISIEDNPNPMWIYDPEDLSILKVNEAALQIYGYTREEICSLTIKDLRPEREHAKLIEEVQKGVSEFSNAGIWEHKDKAGRAIYVRILSTSVTFQDKSCKLVVAQNVTDHIQAQTELEREKERFRLLAENSTDLISRLNKQAVYEYVSPASKSILGYSPDEMEGTTVFGYIHPDDEGRVKELYQNIFGGQDSYKIRYRFKQKKGGWTWVETVGRALIDPETNEVHEVQNSTRDISEGKGYEEELEKEKEFSEKAVNSLPGLFYVLDVENNFVNVNQNFLEELGYSWEELQQMNPLDFYLEKDHEKVKKAINKAFTEGEAELTAQVKTKDGQLPWYQITGKHFIQYGKNYILGAGIDITEQIELESLLQQAHQMARIGAWEFDVHSKKISWTSITKELHEVDPDFKPNMDTAINFYKEGEDRKKIRMAIEEAIKKGRSWDLELRLITNKGNERWVRTIGKPVFKDGECIRLFGSFQDIHERKQAQIKKQEALEERQRILERITDGFFAVDENWNVTYWNKRAEEITGLNRKDILRQNLWETFPEAKELKFFREYKRAFDKQISVQFEEYYSPVKAWLEVNAYPSKEGLSVFFRDVTEKKEAEENVRQTYKKLKTAQSIARLGYWTYDLVKDEPDWSEEVYKIWEQDPEAFYPVHENMLKAIHPEDREFFLQNLEGAFSEKTYSDYEHRIITPDGKIKWIHTRTTLLKDEDGTPVRLEGTVQDITLQKEREEEMKKAIQEKEVLLMEVHHRVKNNLALVSSILQLQAYQTDNDELHQQLANSESRIQSIAIIHELLYQSDSFSQINLKDDITRLIEHVSESFRSNIDISYQLNLEPVIVNVNQAIPFALIVNEVLTNIYKHAFQGKEEGVVEVTLKASHDHIQITVADNGQGLPEDFKLSEQTSLGFKLIHTLSSQLEGNVSYESGKTGAIFSLSFKKGETKGTGSYFL